ncbi:MAG: hypothetical protein LBP62_04070 [Clostridiales bacterium]|nr:hypothetical protein [Clostridiales bacterium]
METKVKEVLEYPPAAALVEELAPGITSHPFAWVVKGMTLGRAFSYREAVKEYLKVSDAEIDGFIKRILDF